MSEIEELVNKDIGITEKALSKLKRISPERSHLREVAEDFSKMAKAYYEDAKHFRDSGDMLRALAAINYAHGWVDAGARIGLFDTGGDDQLFTLAK